MSDESVGKHPFREIVQPFIDLARAPRALWGVNVTYLIEGMVYFGMLGYLAMYFSDFVFRGQENADDVAHKMVMVLTAGITIAMFFLGFLADKWGIRRAMIVAFALMLLGRTIISGAPTVGLKPHGLWSPLHVTTMVGILVVVVGYGIYQPSAYAAVRRFTSAKTAGMGFAMLYAVMNLGGFLPTGAFLLRDEKYLGLGIAGTYWVYTGFTLLALLLTVLILSRQTVDGAIARAKAENEALKTSSGKPFEPAGELAQPSPDTAASKPIPLHMWGVLLAILGATLYLLRTWPRVRLCVMASELLIPIGIAALPARRRRPILRWIATHPLADGRFFFFVFSLMPVQTLFTYNWFVLPQYVSRTYEGWIGEYFEVASNLNPLLIFILVPMVAALTQKRKVYNMMIAGTFMMAAPAFLPAIGPSAWTLFGYIVFMTIGEAMWQPRFLQYAAEIAPEGRTGQYMGVAQLPWFLTKVLVPLLYSGKILATYCPAQGPKNTETMWLIFGCIAITTTILLVVARGWVSKGMKSRTA